MITENLGKIAITPKGQWVAGSYERLDMVTIQALTDLGNIK